MKALVTGGAGYIGSHTVKEFIRAKHEVVVLDNLVTGNREAIDKQARFYEGDLRDAKILNKIFTENKIDVVVHCSAKLIVPESVSQPIDYYENNVHGVAVLLQAMKDAGIKNIVFSSTAAVYGEPTRTPIEEDDQKLPINPYGSSKLACEWLIQSSAKAYGMNYVIFRYFNVAGADATLEIGQATKGMQLSHLIPVVMEVALGIRECLNVYGTDYETKDGTCVRDYIHVSDLALAHIKGAEYTLKNKSNIFNLGSKIGFSVKEVLETSEKVLGQKIPHVFGPRRQGDPAILTASNYRVKKELGFETSYSLEEMILSDYKWRKNRKF